MSAFTRMPPNSLASFEESASDGLSPIPVDTEIIEIVKDNNNQDIKSETEEPGGKEGYAPAPPEATMSYYMNEGGAASILSDMVDRVKHSAQRVSEEVAEAVEGVFHESMLVNSEPPLSRSETPANRSTVSDDGLMESASQRSVRFSDNDSIIDADPNPASDSGRDGDGLGSDVSKGAPPQDDNDRIDSPLVESGTGQSGTKDDARINVIQEQSENYGEGEGIAKDEGGTGSESTEQVTVNQTDATDKNQTDNEAFQQVDQVQVESIEQNNDIQTREESTKDVDTDVNETENLSGDEKMPGDLVQTPDANQDVGTEKISIPQHEQEHYDRQKLNNDQDDVLPESTNRIEQDGVVDEKTGSEITTKEEPAQEEQQSAIVLPEIQEQQVQIQNTAKHEAEQSEDNLTSEQTVDSAITGSPEDTEQTRENSEDVPNEPVMSAVTTDANQGSEINQIPSDKNEIDLSVKDNADQSAVEGADLNEADEKEDHGDGKTDVESEMEEQKKEEEDKEESSDQRESCNRKDDGDDDRDDKGDGGSSGGGEGGAGKSGQGGNSNNDDTREDHQDGPDETGQGDGAHDGGSHGNEESDVTSDNNQNKYSESQETKGIMKETYAIKNLLFNEFDRTPSNHGVTKVTKCWYGELEDDVPEIEDSVLFCAICGLDEDACVCPHSSLPPNRTRSGVVRPTYNKQDINEVTSSGGNRNGLHSAPMVIEGNKTSDTDELDLSLSENKIVLEYKALLGHEAGSGCFSSELTPRKGRPTSQSSVHFLLRGLPVVSGGGGHQDGEDGRKEDDTVCDSGCESEQVEDESLHDGDGSAEVIER